MINRTKPSDHLPKMMWLCIQDQDAWNRKATVLQEVDQGHMK